jgi:hypothetical protein
LYDTGAFRLAIGVPRSAAKRLNRKGKGGLKKSAKLANAGAAPQSKPLHNGAQGCTKVHKGAQRHCWRLPPLSAIIGAEEDSSQDCNQIAADMVL